jgi:hypothetical protein
MNNQTRNCESCPTWPQPKAKKGPWPKKPQQPIKPPAPTPLGRTSVSLEGQTPHRETPASLEHVAPPRVSSRLARGSRPLVLASASLETSLGSRRHTYSPDQGIKSSDTSRAPGSKANPHRANLQAPPGNHISTMFDQPTLYSHPWHCAGAVRDSQCHSVTL